MAMSTLPALVFIFSTVNSTANVSKDDSNKVNKNLYTPQLLLEKRNFVYILFTQLHTTNKLHYLPAELVSRVKET